MASDLLSVLVVLLFAVGTTFACAKPSVLVIGLDGANWAVLDPLIDAGYLPTMGPLLTDGARAEMSCVVADPASACFCPPSWTSIATGRTLADHRIANFETPSSARAVPAIWNVAGDNGAVVTLSSYRGTWPAEPGIDYVFTEPGLDEIGSEMYAVWNLDYHVGRDEPETLFRPADLPQALGILPHRGSRPDSWGILARDRAAMTSLLDLVLWLREAPSTKSQAELTMIVLHGGDKVSHLLWGGLQDEMWGPIKTDALLAAAESWDGPIELPAPWGWGTIAAAYLEADVWLGHLLSAHEYDYVVFVSDHGMTRGIEGFPGDHSPSAAQAHRGIFSIAGPGVLAGATLPEMTVLDVAPTLAYALGFPVADDLPGRVLTEAFTGEHLLMWPLISTPSWE